MFPSKISNSHTSKANVMKTLFEINLTPTPSIPAGTRDLLTFEWLLIRCKGWMSATLAFAMFSICGVVYAAESTAIFDARMIMEIDGEVGELVQFPLVLNVESVTRNRIVVSGEMDELYQVACRWPISQAACRNGFAPVADYPVAVCAFWALPHCGDISRRVFPGGLPPAEPHGLNEVFSVSLPDGATLQGSSSYDFENMTLFYLPRIRGFQSTGRENVRVQGTWSFAQTSSLHPLVVESAFKMSGTPSKATFNGLVVPHDREFSIPKEFAIHKKTEWVGAKYRTTYTFKSVL